MPSPNPPAGPAPAAPRHGVKEEQIEYGFIGTLQKLKYEYRPDITNRATLEANFRGKFEALNRVRLTDSEFARLLAEGKEAAEATVGDYQRESAEKAREYDSTASALEGKRELNEDETSRLKQLWKKLVWMFHPDLHGVAHAPSLKACACHTKDGLTRDAGLPCREGATWNTRISSPFQWKVTASAKVMTAVMKGSADGTQASI